MVNILTPPKIQVIQYPYGFDPHGFYWPESEQKRSEYFFIKRTEPEVAESTYQCRPGNRKGSVFIDSDFNYYQPPFKPSDDTLILQAWDTAFSDTNTSAFTVGITGALVPCDRYHRLEDPLVYGACDNHYDVYILDLYREKIDWGALVNAVKRQYFKWNPFTAVVEKKASGISLLQTFSQLGLNFEGVSADTSKRARATQGVGENAGSVQGWFRQHRVLFPLGADWLIDLIKELKDFTGDNSGTKDQVDALVHLVTYAIRMGAGSVMIPSNWEPNITDVGMDDPRFQGKTKITDLKPLFNMDNQFDPFSGTCARCNQFSNGICKKSGEAKTPFESCYDIDSDGGGIFLINAGGN